MKGKTILGITALTMLSATPSFASTHSHYSVFGNDNVNDCSFVVFANLIQRDWPNTPLTQKEVVSAWRNTPGNIFAFMQINGFSGHYVINETLITSKAEFISIANTEGVDAVVNQDLQGQNLGAHSIAVIGANSKGVTAVWWGQPIQCSWKEWNKIASPINWDLVWSTS